MPIRPELRKFYGPQWRKVVRPRILARAGNKCELCGAPNYSSVLRAFGWWTPANIESTRFKHCTDSHLIQLPWSHAIADKPGEIHRQTACFPRESCHWTGIVLTVAHLNHVAGDDRDENLRALCQWCHLNYDKEHHAETRSKRKDAARPILAKLMEVAS
jgi:hypothetical protein